MTYSVHRGELTDIETDLSSVEVRPAGAGRRAMPYLTAEQIAAGVTLRQARRYLAAWRRLGWPRVYQVPRTGPDGRRLGGVQWVVDAADYDDLCNGRLRPDLPQAA